MGLQIPLRRTVASGDVLRSLHFIITISSTYVSSSYPCTKSGDENGENITINRDQYVITMIGPGLKFTNDRSNKERFKHTSTTAGH